MKANYHQRFNRVIDFIGQHLDEEVSLERLSDLFCISPFHFHRLFTAFTGLSLHQYVRWLRLKRAAQQLLIHKDQSIINIAMDAGFESHEAFTRAFKQACDFSPNQYRQGFGRAYWEQVPYELPQKKDSDMNVVIKKQDDIRLAAVEHRGDVKDLINSLNKLLDWAKAHNVKLKAGEAFAIAYNDPKTTPAADFRIDLGIKIPNHVKLTGDVVEKHIPAGRYASVMHKGSRDQLGSTINQLYREWLPGTGQELGNFPCVFCYYNFEHEVAETESLTECWLLLK